MAFYRKWIEPVVMMLGVIFGLAVISAALITGHFHPRDIAPLSIATFCGYRIFTRGLRRS